MAPATRGLLRSSVRRRLLDRGRPTRRVSGGGHFRTAIVGYSLATFAAVWAWINFAWFSSAFDTDDWVYRLLTLVQMIGVAIIAIGMPAVFESIDADQHVDIAVVVIGYLVMRAAMILQWLRAAAQAPDYRSTCLVYALMTTIAQVGWVAVAVVPLNLTPTLIGIAICMAIELLGPGIAETRFSGTPWHPGHIVERYSTLIVITLGEGVVGTVAVLQAIIGNTGWSVETAILGLAAMGVTFAMWWLYFGLDVGRPLARRPQGSFVFGYGSMVIIVSSAAVGSGFTWSRCGWSTRRRSRRSRCMDPSRCRWRSSASAPSACTTSSRAWTGG